MHTLRNDGEVCMLFLFRSSLVILAFFLSMVSAYAATFDRSGFHITIEPIIGYEFTQVNTPTLHTRGMLIYGARFTAGHKMIAGEGEYTMGSTNETFPTQDQNVKTDKQNARLGLRSELPLMMGAELIFRAGGQASKTKVGTTTISTATTLTSAPDWEIHPYAGTGLQVHLFHAFSLALEATYLFRSIKDWSQNDVQTTFSFKIHLPTK